MKEIKSTKQVVGIDISKDKFDATICITDAYSKKKFISATDSFDNNKKGFSKLLSWVRKQCDKNIYTIYVMEATGVYYENLAYYLNKLKQKVSVVLANKVKNYARCLNVKTKTDKIDSRIISQMGAEQSLTEWEPPKMIYRTLRSLTRMHRNLKDQTTVLSNQLEALNNSYNDGLDYIIKNTKKLIDLIKVQIEKCEEEITKLINSDAYLKERVDNIITIKGVGIMTAATIIAETYGFANVENCKQLVSYAGLDVVERQSGSSVRGKTRISKKGNSRIRGALYFPAMNASRTNSVMKEYYDRVNEGRKIKMPGVVALERKLLILIYTLWKKNEPAIG